jgi:methionyl-tRNA formyltransferase
VANPVKGLAEELALPILQPASLRDPDVHAEIAQLDLDVLIVASYGLILPAEVLTLPTYGCLNVHASLLPRWRGAAPIERAIMAGDTKTGVCIMQMEAGLDTGPVYASEVVPITEHTTAKDLYETLAENGAKSLLKVLKTLAAAKAGKAPLPSALAQNNDLATYAHKLNKGDRLINWHQSAEQITHQVTALADRLPVRTSIKACGVQFLAARSVEQTILREETVVPGTIVDVSNTGITIQCATDLLQITSLKVERGKGKILDPAAALNGFKDLFYPSARFVTPV